MFTACGERKFVIHFCEFVVCTCLSISYQNVLKRNIVYIQVWRCVVVVCKITLTLWGWYCSHLHSFFQKVHFGKCFGPRAFVVSLVAFVSICLWPVNRIRSTPLRVCTCVGPEWTSPNDCTLAVLSIGWVGWFTSFSFTSLPYINQHSTSFNLVWLLTFWLFLFLVANFLPTRPSILPTHLATLLT